MSRQVITLFLIAGYHTVMQVTSPVINFTKFRAREMFQEHIAPQKHNQKSVSFFTFPLFRKTLEKRSPYLRPLTITFKMRCLGS
jgi:hypothetical protein